MCFEYQRIKIRFKKMGQIVHICSQSGPRMLATPRAPPPFFRFFMTKCTGAKKSRGQSLLVNYFCREAFFCWIEDIIVKFCKTLFFKDLGAAPAKNTNLQPFYSLLLARFRPFLTLLAPKVRLEDR